MTPPEAANAEDKEKPASRASPAKPAEPVPAPDAPAAWSRFFSGFLKIRDEPGPIGRLLMGGLCIGLVVLAWWLVTRGATPEARLVSPSTLPSPGEVLRSFKSLWFERALTRNTMASLLRVLEGYGLALLIGVPLGILGGCFRRFNAFLAPITIFGRNIPVAALVPLTLLWFGTDESQKVLFIFIACVAFVISGATDTVNNVDQKYLDTAYTLGASRTQVIFKVLVPLALPDLFNSMRLLFGLGFGYIILAEVVNMDTGLGALISTSQRRGMYEHVYLCLLVITLVAYVLDRLLYWIGKQLFAYRFRG